MRRASLLLLLTACSGGDPLLGLLVTPLGLGPRVVWDPFAEPLPEVPFPNDIATRADLTSPTGRRLNISRQAPTAFERRLRALSGRMDGFGAFTPFSVRFAPADVTHPARLDLDRIAATQRGDGDFHDDVVLLVDVTPASPTYGHATALDFGNGNFPLALEDQNAFFDNDPRGAASNLLFDTYDEDLDGDGRFDAWEDTNQNGALDPGEDRDNDGRLDAHEDSDGDGVFDRPNLWGTFAGDPARLDPYADLIEFYDLAEDMLFFRPLTPLRERTTYAVVLMSDLVGVSGEPVRSPFDYVHHLQQTAALRPLADDHLLDRYGRDLNDVAFAWTFTTQSSSADLVALREGLNGEGKLAWLGAAYAPEVTHLAPVLGVTGPAQFRLPPAEIINILRLVFAAFPIPGMDPTRIQPVIDSYAAVDYVVAGDYAAPDILDAGADGAFDLDAGRGRLVHRPGSRRFLLVVPRAQYGTPPFPVVLYCHGYTSMKLEALAFAGVLAKYGVATFVIDAYGHGLPLGAELIPLVESFLGGVDVSRIRPFLEAVFVDRARDLNGDSFPDVGGDFYTHDSFRTRDAIRQTIVDYLQGSRVLRGFDGRRVWPFDLNGDGAGGDLAGDFNGDGVVDVGGPNTPYYTTGMSMGGVHSTILGAVEPTVLAAAPVSPGGGLIEIGMRTDLGGVVHSVLLPMMGPMVITRPVVQAPLTDDRVVELAWMVQDVTSRAIKPFARVGRIEGSEVADRLLPGDTLEVRNLTNGESDAVVVNASRRVRAHVPADKGDAVVVTVKRANGDLVKEVRTFELSVENFQGKAYEPGEPLVAIQQGLGLRRNSHDLRRLLSLVASILDPADPINYAGRYAEPLSVRGHAPAAKSLLIVLTMGDMSVPISAGVALARAAGLVDPTRVDPTYGVTQNQLLIDTHVTESVEKLSYFAGDPCHYDARAINFDIDDLSDGRHAADLPRLGKIARPPECAGATPPADCDRICDPLPPLRATRRAGSTVQAMRMLALDPDGRHVIDLPDPRVAFDPSMFVLNQIGVLFRSRGSELSDHPCLAANDCATCRGEPGCPVIPPPPIVVE